MSQSKRDLRRAALARRDGLSGDLDAATAHLLEALGPGPGIAAIYLPMRGEIDPRPAAERLIDMDWAICAPEVAEKGRHLLFRPWTPNAPLKRGAYGEDVPNSAESLIPTALVVPLLAFDRRGTRLGYGGGYYDRTLAALDGPLAVGFAWAGQEIPALPRAPHDHPLDLIVTEAGILTPEGP